MVNPVLKELIEIINETPLSIRSEVRKYNKLPNGQMIQIESEGFTQLIDKDLHKYGICLNASCYHLEENLVHECLHIAYRNAGEMDIEDLTKYFIKYDEVYQAAQVRVNERVKYMRG